MEEVEELHFDVVDGRLCQIILDLFIMQTELALKVAVLWTVVLFVGYFCSEELMILALV